METYTARLASFKLHPSKRKINEPYSASIAWPHSSTRFSVTPSTLAQAGFYHDPTESADDNVTCFICNKGLEGWEDGDDALDEHLKRVIDKNTNDKCPWATIMGVKRDFDLFGKVEYENGKHDPSSTLLNTARKNTFGDWWKFDGKKGWKPTSERLAQAGFYNNPLKDAPDTCACAYCDVQLDGWSKNDDPEKEHHSRRPDCFFFTAPSSSRGAGPSGSAPKENLKASRSTSRKKAIPASHQQQKEEEDDSIVIVTESAPAKVNNNNKSSASTSRKGKNTKSRSATSASIISEAEESALEEPASQAEKQNEDETIASKAATMTKGKKGKTTIKNAALKSSTRNKQHVEDTIIELDSEVGEEQDTQHQQDEKEVEKEKVGPAKTRTRSTRSNTETSILPPPVGGAKKAATTRKSTAVRSTSKSKKKIPPQQEEDTEHDNEQDEEVTEMMTENETEMSEAEPSQSQSQSQSQKPTRSTKAKGKSLSRSTSSTENKSTRSKNKTITKGKKNDDDEEVEVEEPELSEERSEAEAEPASRPGKLSKSTSSSSTMNRPAATKTKGKGKKSVQQDQVEVSEQSEADLDQRNETGQDKDTTLSRSVSTTSSTRRTRNTKAQLENSIVQTDTEEDAHEEEAGEAVEKKTSVKSKGKKTTSAGKATKKSTSSRKKQSIVEEESAAEEEDEENATTTMDASTQPTQHMDESAISFSTSTRDTSTPQPSTTKSSGKHPYPHTAALEHTFTSESEISHISQTDDNASVPSSSSPPLEQQQPSLLPSSENNLPDVPTPKAQSGGRHHTDALETVRKPMIQEGRRDEEISELVVKKKDAFIANPPAMIAIDLEDTAATASKLQQNGMVSTSRAIPSESSAPRLVKPIPKRLSNSNADSSTSNKDGVAPSARSSRSKTTTKQAKSTSNKRSKDPSAILVPSGQSALDALLAGPVPTFDSPEKQAARPQPRADLIANKQPLGATSPSSVQNTLARNLSPEEENMPVKDWFERIRQEQISRFIAQSDALLTEFDTQAQHKRAQLVDLARNRTLQHS